jgi:(2R)-3-sulfolactate dehydrogenase (NADP+)
MTAHDVQALQELCIAAAVNAGASDTAAQALAEAIMAAELRGRSAVGLEHFFDFLHGFATGGIEGSAVPEITHKGAMVWADARGGIAHTGFKEASGTLAKNARRQGCAVFLQSNSYTCGELGYFTDYFAREGLLAFASANSPALLAPPGSRRPVLGTNPISMAAPLDQGPPLLIDQASSQVAYVSIRQAAQDGRPIPEGWALDAEGEPTTNPRLALDGALLPFGDHKGANIALMVEVLAGLAGGNWSVDAPSFLGGEGSPGIGMFLLVIDPNFGNRSFPRRLRIHLERMQEKYGVQIPGRRGTKAGSTDSQQIRVPKELYARLQEAASQHRADVTLPLP